ncbi:ATP-binding cassette domain-containing protein [Clostridium paridis]|uniref:ABC transporter ATP-binding protein n=1 Tax=Clostridium paridis TaxID=2803863 RepID=A0A937FCJ4_9CLOT|nr:ATP-binding cassette domain-containing protein [Clostridium paridis]MBL4931389.1 ABC transporter ATP-binding protein [Clostridium paridis]
MNKEDKNIIIVENLSKHYIVKKNILSKKNLIKAVDNVSFEIKEGEALGLIGESGCGKSTTASLILNLIKADEGKIIYKNMDLTKINDDVMRGLRKDLQIIFQASQGTLDPLMTIDELLKVPLKLHKIVDNSELDCEVTRLLNLVELSESDKYKYPYQMSGGQRQRIGIARAIATKPSFIICDEPVSALDVSIQGQILNLLETLREELKLTYLFISHDLKVVKHLCDRIAVMNKGKIVEIGETRKILENPKEEYTKKLISSQLFV